MTVPSLVGSTKQKENIYLSYSQTVIKPFENTRWHMTQSPIHKLFYMHLLAHFHKTGKVRQVSEGVACMYNLSWYTAIKEV